jgi:TonB-dependent starch-binding outer membrane protein SusC
MHLNAHFVPSKTGSTTSAKSGHPLTTFAAGKRGDINEGLKVRTKLLLIMNFTAIIFLATCLQVSAMGHSQTITLSESNASLEKIFRELKRQTVYDFWYESKLLKNAKKVDIQVKDASIEEVLNICFQNQMLTYSIVEKTIIVKPAAARPTEVTHSPPPPPFTVSGNITDANGQPLEGASVKLKGRGSGTTTDSRGYFSLQVPEAGGVLVVSYVGYQVAELPVSRASSSIKIALTQLDTKIDEVVVVGYGTQKRKDLTGSVSSIGPAQIENVPVTTLDQAIQGRAAGVNVTNNDGTPGASVFIQIRGIGSLGSNTPLYVVDGYPITGGLNALNANDIATIDILKDASATAIYGNRAANGVVIITTKRGKKNGVEVSLDPTFSVQSQPKMYDVLNAQQWVTLVNERAPIDNIQVLPEWSNPSALHSIDWQDEVYRTGLRQDYNLALRGGSEKIQSAFSAGYFNQRGIVLGSEYKRLNAGLNLDYNAFSWLRSASSIKFTRRNYKNHIGTGGQIGDSEEKGILDLGFLPPTMTGNKLTDKVKDGNGNYGFFPPANVHFFLYNYGNPVYDAETDQIKNENDIFLGTTSLEATVFPGLRLKTNFGISTNEGSGYLFKPSDTRSLEQYGDPGIQRAQNTYSQYALKSFEWLWENTVSYTKTFGDHSIDFVGGVSAQENTFRHMGVKGFGSISDVLRDVGSIQNITDLVGNQQTYSLASQFGRLNYKLMDRYLITATIRRDGSSKFAPDHQYGVFPSGSIAWRIKEESFMKDVDFINDLKIRASYGEVGNQDGVAPFQYLAQYSTGGPQIDYGNFGYPFNGTYQPGLQLAALPNPDLKWETTKMTDIGLDITLMNGALTLTADYYRKESKDFLLNIPVPTQTGFVTAARNVGSIRNSGVEFAADYHKAISKDLSYGVNFNITTVNNKLISLTGDLKTLSDLQLSSDGQGLGFSPGWSQFSLTKIGGPVGEFYGYKAAGIFQSQQEIDALNAKAESVYGPGAAYQPGAQPGDRKFVDINGDDQVTADDRTSLGSPIPKVFGGLNLDATYKAFDFNVFFYGVFGNKILNFQRAVLESFGGLQNISEEYYNNAWKPDRPSNRYARVTNEDNNDNNRPSDVYAESGNYVRLRNVQVGYTLPASLAGKVSITRLRLFVSAQNLFTITNYSGLDPEIGLPQQYDGAKRYGVAGPNEFSRNVGSSGVDVGTYPISRIYTFGLNVTF